jgi:O-succinylbenzoic acid--CoA ligase
VAPRVPPDRGEPANAVAPRVPAPAEAPNCGEPANFVAPAEAALSFRAAAAETPDRVALIEAGRRWTYAALAPHVAAAGRRLVALDLPPDTPVALVADARRETLVAVWALLERGIPALPLHPRLTGAEADALIERAGARFLTADEVTQLGAPFDDGVRWPEAAPIDPEAAAALIFTSGTSGTPKGAVLPRRAFVAGAAAAASRLGWRDGDGWLLCMPLGHVGGLTILTRCLAARRTVVLLPRFEPAALLRAIREDGATILSVVPAMLPALLDADADGTLALPRAVIVGGAALPDSLRRRALSHGVKVLATYGLSEACAMSTLEAPGGTATAGSGTALPGVGIEVVGPDGAPLPPGEPGAIRVRGPTLMRGYLGKPPLAGAFDTGDVGTLDADGTLHVHARRTDLIVTGGENVYPAEVEAALERCPGVREALVFGVPDERWGAVVAAAIVPAAAPFDPAAALAEAAARLASFKRPRLCAVVDALPRTPAGKPDRRGAPGLLAGALRPVARA